MGFRDWLGRWITGATTESVIDIEKEIQDRLSVKALAFYVCVSYVTDVISKCEIKRFINHVETKDKFYYLLNVSPNLNEKAFELKSKLIFKLFYDGHALMFENKGSLYVADSFLIEHRPLKGNLYTNISLNNETVTFTKKAEDVFYFNLDDGKLKSLVNSMLEDYSELLKYSFETYKDTQSEKYKLIMDEVRAGDTDFKENFEKIIKKQLEAFINGKKAVYPQFKGYDLQLMHKSNGDTDSSDAIQLRKEIIESTAEAFKMPKSLLNGSVSKEDVDVWATVRIDPIAKMISEELTRKTGTFESYEKGTYFDVDTTTILHADVFDLWDKLYNVLGSGTYCIDEMRVKLGDSPLNTDFSKQHWISKNYSKVETALAEETYWEGGG